jgi:hypothetical protein
MATDSNFRVALVAPDLSTSGGVKTVVEFLC